MQVKRKLTRKVKVGNLIIGNGNPIIIQSMCINDPKNYNLVIDEIKRLEEAGCQIIRIGIPDESSAKNISKIKNAINIPLVADIHFDYKLALIAIDEGVDKLRLNPGNIKNKDHISKIVEAAKKRNIPIRIGVNSGSVPKELLQKNNNIITPNILVEAALYEIKLLEEQNFYDIVISLKSSSPIITINAYRLISQICNYPLHLGVTEAGILKTGQIRSSIGIGILLFEGIGDTIRVSLTDDPINEIIVAKQILNTIYQPTSL